MHMHVAPADPHDSKAWMPTRSTTQERLASPFPGILFYLGHPNQNPTVAVPTVVMADPGWWLETALVAAP